MERGVGIFDGRRPMRQLFQDAGGRESMNRVLAFIGAVLGFLMAVAGGALLTIIVLRADLTTGAVEALGLATLGAGLVGGSEMLKNQGKKMENS